MSVKGITEIDAKLAAMEKKIKDKVIRPAARKAVQPIVSLARSMAPRLQQSHKGKTPGLLADTIEVKSRTSKGMIGVTVVASGEQRGKVNSFVASLIEFGFHVGTRSEGVKSLGRKASRATKSGYENLAKVYYAKQKKIDKRSMIEGKHYMTRAAEQGFGSAVQIFNSEVAATLPQALQ